MELTQEYVANKLKMSISTLQKLETGGVDIASTKTFTAYKLAKFYEVDIEYLLELEKQKE